MYICIYIYTSMYIDVYIYVMQVFYTTHGPSEVSRYEYNNQDTAGVTAIIQRYKEGRLPPLYSPHGAPTSAS